MLRRAFNLSGSEVGEPKPIRAGSTSPFQVAVIAAAAAHPERGRLYLPCRFHLEDAPRRSRSPVTKEQLPHWRVPAALPATTQGSTSSARAMEDAARAKFAWQWVAASKAVTHVSDSLQAGISDEQLLPLFLDRAPTTLRKHLSGWRVWCSFCALSKICAGAPSLPQLLDFLQSLTDGSFSDRGCNRQRTVLSVLSAMTFASAKLELSPLQALLAGPLIEAWKRKDCWRLSRTKEALPLPLDAMRLLERAFLDSTLEDSWLLGGLLFMAWAGLRFSDMQRLDLASINCADGFIAGWCWRTKSSKRGMPWAFLICGISGNHWGKKWFATLDSMRKSSPQQDFLLAVNDKPMSYTMALEQFRRCLVCHGGMSADFAHRFTLHSLKATVLCWANALGLAEPERAA